MSAQNQDQTTQDWLKYPTGKIGKGEFCSCCKRYNTRNMTATTIGLNQADQVLLIKRKINPQAGWWALPGGYIDWDETLAETAAREFKEETGLELTNLHFFGLYDALDRDKDGRQNVDHCYVGMVAQPQSIVLNQDEVITAEWFSFDQLPDNIAFDHRQMLEDYYGRR